MTLPDLVAVNVDNSNTRFTAGLLLKVIPTESPSRDRFSLAIYGFS